MPRYETKLTRETDVKPTNEIIVETHLKTKAKKEENIVKKTDQKKTDETFFFMFF